MTILDDLGAVDEGDDSTRVSIEITRGDATIVPEVATVSSGRTFFQLHPKTVGDLQLTISIPGLPELVRTFDVLSGVALDLGPGPEDEGIRDGQISSDEKVSVEIHFSGGLDLLGIEVLLETGSMGFDRFEAGPAIEGTQLLITEDAPLLRITAGLLGGVLPETGGLIGKVILQPGAVEHEVIKVVAATLGGPSGVRPMGIGSAAEVRLRVEHDPLTWDKLRSQFGLDDGNDGFDVRYDLDGDGVIGFQDFLQFAQTQ